MPSRSIPCKMMANRTAHTSGRSSGFFPSGLGPGPTGCVWMAGQLCLKTRAAAPPHRQAMKNTPFTPVKGKRAGAARYSAMLPREPPQVTATTACWYVTPENRVDISRTSGGHRKAWAKPFTHQITNMSAGSRQKAIKRFARAVVSKPPSTSRLGWTRSPKKPLTSCPAP